MRPLLFVALLSVFAACSSGDDDSPPPVVDAGAPDAAADTAHDAPPPPTATVDCAVDSDAELEPNDTEAQATEFTGLAVCGVLSGSDVDYLKFTTPDGQKLGSFLAVVNGKVDFDITLAGKTFKPGDTENYGSGTFLVKAYLKEPGSGSYRIRLRFDDQ